VIYTVNRPVSRKPSVSFFGPVVLPTRKHRAAYARDVDQGYYSRTVLLSTGMVCTYKVDICPYSEPESAIGTPKQHHAYGLAVSLCLIRLCSLACATREQAIYQECCIPTCVSWLPLTDHTQPALITDGAAETCKWTSQLQQTEPCETDI
jgi:hypothetical protein